MDRWSHFEYTSGANPYIAKTSAERDRVIGKYKRLGIAVDNVGLIYSGRDLDTEFYIVHDREGRTE